MIEKILKKLNLSNKEIDIYLTNLKTGNARVTTIAQRAEMSRSTTYNILHNLREKGFTKLVTKANIQYFSPIEPKEIITLLQNQQEETESKIKLVEQYLPQLESICNPNLDIPNVSFYEGVEGIKQIYEDIARISNKTTYAALSLDNILPELKKWLITVFTPRKIKKNISSEILLSSTNATPYQKLDNKQLRKTKVIPYEGNPFEVEIDVYDDTKTAFISYDEAELFGVIIDSPRIARSMKTLLKLVQR